MRTTLKEIVYESRHGKINYVGPKNGQVCGYSRKSLAYVSGGAFFEKVEACDDDWQENLKTYTTEDYSRKPHIPINCIWKLVGKLAYQNLFTYFEKFLDENCSSNDELLGSQFNIMNYCYFDSSCPIKSLPWSIGPSITTNINGVERLYFGTPIVSFQHQLNSRVANELLKLDLKGAYFGFHLSDLYLDSYASMFSWPYINKFPRWNNIHLECHGFQPVSRITNENTTECRFYSGIIHPLIINLMIGLGKVWNDNFRKLYQEVESDANKKLFTETVNKITTDIVHSLNILC